MEKRTLSEKELLLYQAVIELLDEGMEVHQIKVSDITNRAGVGKGTAYADVRIINRAESVVG